jgi:hypothetical protein
VWSQDELAPSLLWGEGWGEGPGLA